MAARIVGLRVNEDWQVELKHDLQTG